MMKKPKQNPRIPVIPTPTIKIFLFNSTSRKQYIIRYDESTLISSADTNVRGMDDGALPKKQRVSKTLIAKDNTEGLKNTIHLLNRKSRRVKDKYEIIEIEISDKAILDEFNYYMGLQPCEVPTAIYNPVCKSIRERWDELEL